MNILEFNCFVLSVVGGVPFGNEVPVMTLPLPVQSSKIGIGFVYVCS